MARPAKDDTQPQTNGVSAAGGGAVIPEGWKRYQLSALIESLDTGVSVYAENRTKLDGEFGVLKTSAVSYGIFNPFEHKAVLPAEENRLATCPKKDTIIICRSNTSALVGSSAYVDKNYDDLFLPDTLWRITQKSENVSMHWFSYLLNSNSMRQKLLSIAAGTSGSMKKISKRNFLRLHVELPPLPEQRAIAAILGTWDRALELCERRLAAAEQRKKALMQQLLTGRVRFPEFVIRQGYKPAFGTQVPLDWRILEFSNFALRCSKKFDPKKDSKVYKCVELEHISQNTGVILGTISTKGQKSIKNYFEPGLVLFGKLRPYLRKYARPDFEGVCSSEIWVLRGKENLCSNHYLFHLVQHDRFMNAATVTSGTKMPRSDWKYLSEFAFTLPSLPEQRRIAAVLSACDREIALLAQKRDALQRQKKGLMQRLLTGRVRVAQS